MEEEGDLRGFLGGKNVVLMGMMGCGKSTLGRAVAGRFQMKFVDSDREIEQASGYSVPELIANDGIDFFRDRESKVVSRLLSSEGYVVSLGGGSVTTALVREEVKERSVSVWLRADVDVLCYRLRRSYKRRPLLVSEEHTPKEIMERLLKEREVFYGCADLELYMDGKSDLSECTDRLSLLLWRYVTEKDREIAG